MEDVYFIHLREFFEVTLWRVNRAVVYFIIHKSVFYFTIKEMNFTTDILIQKKYRERL